MILWTHNNKEICKHLFLILPILILLLKVMTKREASKREIIKSEHVEIVNRKMDLIIEFSIKQESYNNSRSK